jgi:cytochrome P450
VLWHPKLGVWLVPGHAAARTLLRDEGFPVIPIGSNLMQLGSRAGREFPALRDVLDTVPFLVNPPAHSALRRFVAGILTTQAISAWVPAMREITAQLLEPLKSVREFDAAADFADRLPPLFMARLLGLPEDKVPELIGLTTGVIAVFNRVLRMREYSALEPKAAAALGFVRGVVAERRAAPRDDAISRMIAARYDGEPLDDAHVANLALMIFLVGVETTSTLIGSSIRTLLANPEHYAVLRRDRALLKGAVEEVLRAEAPVQMVTRITARAREIGGQRFAPGERVLVILGAANRDPRVYPDPDRFDPRREGAPNLAFADGPHTCVGATLSRTETQIALDAFLDLPPLALAAGGESWWPYDWLRRIRHLKVEFS